MDIYFRNSSGSAYASTSQITLTTDWQYYSLSLSGSPDQLDLFRVRCFKGTNGNIIYIRNIRLVSNNMPIRNTIIYDCSGYQNNGTVVGTLTAAAGSPRYEIATVFNGDSYSLTPSGSFNWWDFDKGTFCVWMRPAATASGWSGSVGIAGDNDATKKAFDLTYYANSFRITYANTSYTTIATGKTLPGGEWHFCAATIDGNEVKIYFDGELITTSTIDWKTATLPSNLRFQVGVDLPGTTEKFNGSYSDVRFYSTVLTAEQVKELYNTPVSIDSSGKLYTRELKEV